jgi:hypothetical protein
MRMMIVVLILSFFSFVSADVIIQTETLPTSSQLYEMAISLEAAYPEIISVEILGYSNDQRPIYVIQLSSKVDQVTSAHAYVNKYHYFIEGGIHSRENVAPFMLLQLIETYAKDYYNPDTIPSVDMTSILNSYAFHFIPLSNPDGYDLANFGIQMIDSPYKEKLLSFQSQDFSQYKSNVNGVDLNRNFPGVYYNTETNTFVDVWNQVKNEIYSGIPGSGYYYGPYEASEIETRLLMDYALKYDFRNYLSYHSRGEVIYYYKWMLSQNHNNQSLYLANQIAKYNDYEPVFTSKNYSGSGYLTDFTAMNTLKPSLTVETLSGHMALPAPVSYVKRVLNEQLLVPIIAAQVGENTGYYDYKVYVDDHYVRDYPTQELADVYASKYQGKVYVYEGKPSYKVPLEFYELNRLQGIILLYMEMELKIDQEAEPFDDSDNVYLLDAKAEHIVSGYNNLFHPENSMTYSQAYVILAKFLPDQLYETQISYETEWASQSVNQLLYHNVINLDDVKTGQVTYGNWKKLIENVRNLSK